VQELVFVAHPLYIHASKGDQTEAVLQVLVCRCVKKYTIYENITCLERSRIEIFMNLQSCPGIGYFGGSIAGHYSDKDELARFYNGSSEEYNLLKGTSDVILM
jgi:hypothetical protein